MVDISKTVELIDESRVLQREIVLLRDQIKVLTDELTNAHRRELEAHEYKKQLLELHKAGLFFGLGGKKRKY